MATKVNAAEPSKVNKKKANNKNQNWSTVFDLSWVKCYYCQKFGYYTSYSPKLLKNSLWS